MCQALYKAREIQWPVRQMQNLPSQYILEKVIRLKALSFSLQAKGLNPPAL